MTGASADILERLVDQARAGDRQAFSEIVRRLMSRVTALTYKMTGDRDTALDLAQESFIAAWEKLRTYRGEASFSSWLYRIATNKTLNYLKSAARQTTVDDLPDRADPSDQASPERSIHRKELAASVREFMATLPPQQRAIFELRFYKEMSFEEIARATDRALGTVKTGYREAVKKLRVFARDKGWRS
jgi:RNA polymerase sigma-70 factor (ECF subfamily)